MPKTIRGSAFMLDGVRYVGSPPAARMADVRYVDMAEVGRPLPPAVDTVTVISETPKHKPAALLALPPAEAVDPAASEGDQPAKTD